MELGLNSPLTSSTGRLFDAAAAILGFTGRMVYSAQAPMELEAKALRAHAARDYPHGALRDEEGLLLIDPLPLVGALADDARAGCDGLNWDTSGWDAGAAARGFHTALAKLFAEATLRVAEGVASTERSRWAIGLQAKRNCVSSTLA